ncbi:hypothetical protein VTK56DRAFT_9539 [Thermocarpiscus australiensis]
MSAKETRPRRAASVAAKQAITESYEPLDQENFTRIPAKSSRETEPRAQSQFSDRQTYRRRCPYHKRRQISPQVLPRRQPQKDYTRVLDFGLDKDESFDVLDDEIALSALASADDKEDADEDEEAEDWGKLLGDDEYASLQRRTTKATTRRYHKKHVVVSTAIPATVDEDGLIRVRPQPMKEWPFVRTAPLRVAKSVIRSKVKINFRHTDSKFLDEGAVDHWKAEVLRSLLNGLVAYTGDRVFTMRDYTGLDMSWAPGPRSWSIEATYPFVVSGGKVLYHAPPNVGVIIAPNHPILVLPLLGQYLRIHQEPDFHLRKATWTWTYTAMCNVAVMKIFGCTLSHKSQIEKRQKWDKDKRKAVLEYLRTAVYDQVVQGELDGWTLEELFIDGRDC